jgi:hypothetical protein
MFIRACDPSPTEGRKVVLSVFPLSDDEVVRRGPLELLDSDRTAAVIGEAGTATHALAWIAVPRTRRRDSGRPAARRGNLGRSSRCNIFPWCDGGGGRGCEC